MALGIPHLQQRPLPVTHNKLKAELRIFLAAGVDYPGGFLYEWWVVFWEIFNTRSNQSYSEAAASYLEVREQ